MQSNTNRPKTWRRTGLVIVLLFVLGAVAGISALRPASPATSSRPITEAARGVVKNSNVAEAEQEAYAANPVLGGSKESAQLQSIEDYWHTRVTYPTGVFNGAWLQNAAAQDKNVRAGVPAGRVVYSRQNNRSPLALDPTRFTALGPQPLQSNGCLNCYSYGHVSGRVNDIVIDPVDTTVAYLASVGGGVWKTTNCCTPSTSWTPMTDDPLISTVSIDDLSIDPTNHNTIYAGTGDLNYGSFSMGSAGILKSTDAGATWSIKGADVFGAYYPQPVGVYPQYQAVGKIEADPRNSNTLVAGTKTGIYFSYNGGDTWTSACLPAAAFPTQRQDITGLLMHNNGTATDLYAVVGTRGTSTTVQINLAENGANGIYKTTVPASGCPANWTVSSRADNGWPAGTASGIPQYQTGGNQLGRIDVAISASNPDTIYAIVQAINPTGIRYSPLGVWRTTDGGQTWAARATTSNFTGCDGPGAQSWYNQHIEIDPNNPNVVYADAIDIFRSQDGGQNFTNLTCGYSGGNTVHVDQHALAYVPGSSSVLLSGSDGGAYVTQNADGTVPTFSQLNDSLNTIEFYSGDITANFATSSSPGANAGAQDNGSAVYVWNAPTPVGPAMWQLRKGGDGMFARIEPVLGQRWYQESQNGNLAVTTAGPYSGQTSATGGWTADTRSFTFPYEIYKYDCPATGCTHLIAGSNRVWETITGGVGSSSWYANSPNLTKNTLADRSFINQLSYSVALSTTAIVGTNDGNVQYGFGLGAGTANTATWVDVTGGNAVLPNRPVLDVTTDPVNPLIGYASIGGFNENTPSTPGHVYQVTCTANCATYTWVDKSGNLPNIPIDSILANPLFPQQVFAGSDWGLYYTDNINTANPVWLRFNAGLPNVMIWDMSIDRGFTTLALFTRSRGAYVWPLPAGPVGGNTPTPTNTQSPTSPTVTPTSTSIIPTVTVTVTVIGSTPTSTGTAVVSTATSTSTPGGNTATPTITTTPCSITFTDVHPTDYFYAAVRDLTCRGAISGYSDNTFRPYNDTTRGQLAKIVVLSEGFPIDTTGGPHFSDVPTTNPFYAFIETAYNRGLISGYSDGTFRWGNNITRGQLSKVVVLAEGWPIDVTGGPHFTDVPTTNAFYTFIETAYNHAIISGYSDGTFRPNNNATRGQIAVIVYRAISQP